MNQKKPLYILLCLFVFFPGSVLASAIHVEPYFDGYYMGLGSGIVSSVPNIKTESNIKILYHNLNINHDSTFGNKTGINGNIFIGFGRTLDSVFYLSGELFGNIFDTKMSDSVETNDSTAQTSIKLDTEFKNPYSFGGDIKAGYLIYPRVMLYLLFGLDYAKFKISNDLKSYAYATPVEFYDNFNKWKLGYMPGIGIETRLADHLSLRAQYDYTFYSSFSNSSTKSVGGRYPYLVTMKTKANPIRRLFTLKLVYLFN